MRKMPSFLTVMALLLSLAAAQTALPDGEMSEMENRVLSTRPAFSASAFWNGRWDEAFEAYAADQMPLRDALVSLHTAAQALTGRREINGVLIGQNGWLFERTDGYLPRNVSLNAEALQTLSQRTGLRLRLLAAPSSGAVYGEYLPKDAPMADEEALLALAEARVEVIPLLPALLREKTETTLYYRTDHHWTAAGAETGYRAICKELGLAPLPMAETEARPGFFGSYFARCPLPWVAGDAFSYAQADTLELTVEGKAQIGWVDESQLARRDAYAALLYGNHGYMELLNPQGERGTLLVLKDSYANALLPLLSRHYQKIIAVDPRYFSGDIVETFNETEGEEILCVCGLNFLAASRALALLEGL